MSVEFEQLLEEIKLFEPADGKGAPGEPLDVRLSENTFYESAVMYYPVAVISVLRFKDSSPVHAGRAIVYCAMNEWRSRSIKEHFSN